MELENTGLDAKHNKGVAMADASMSTGSGQGMHSIVDSEGIAKTQHEVRKLDGLVKNPIVTTSMPSIDVTDGEWHVLPCFQNTSVNADDTPIKQIYYHLANVPINNFMGYISLSDTGGATLGRGFLTSSDPSLKDYIYFKCQHLNIKFKNFNVLVERDNSGGIQIQDDFIFQIRRVYYADWKGSTVTTLNDPTSFSYTELQKGLNMPCKVDTKGWIPASNLYNNDLPTGVVKYRDAGTVLTQNASNQGYLVFAEDLPYRYEIRLANGIDATNITIFLSYVVEASGQWTAQGRSYYAPTVTLPLPLVPFTTVIDEDQPPRKRKLMS